MYGGDFYPPRVFAKLDAPRIEYSIQIHDPRSPIDVGPCGIASSGPS
jgi:hypothetical protein